jgi:hypothetical protein
MSMEKLYLLFHTDSALILCSFKGAEREQEVKEREKIYGVASKN